MLHKGLIKCASTCRHDPPLHTAKDDGRPQDQKLPRHFGQIGKLLAFTYCLTRCKQEGRGESWGEAWQRGDPACQPAPLTSRTHSKANHDTPQYPKLLCLVPSHTRLRTAIAATQARGGEQTMVSPPSALLLCFGSVCGFLLVADVADLHVTASWALCGVGTGSRNDIGSTHYA
jgi:hypothetical protein